MATIVKRNSQSARLAGQDPPAHSSQSRADEEDSTTATVAWRYLSVSFLLLFAGAYILHASEAGGERHSAVREEFEHGLEVWEARHRADFQSTNWHVRINQTDVQLELATQGHVQATATLPEHTRTTFTLGDLYDHLLPRTLLDREGARLRRVDLPHGATLEVTGAGSHGGKGEGNEPPVDAPAGPELPVDVEVNVDLALVAREGEVVSEIKLGEYQVVRSTVKKTNNWKNCKYRLLGIPVSGRNCLLVQAISGICARVNRGDNGKWQLDGNLTTSGCAGRRDNSGAVVRYAAIRRPLQKRNNASVIRIPKTLAKSKLEVRSTHDPDFLAMELMAKHNLEGSTEYSAWGTVFLLMGAVVFIPAMILLLSTCSTRRGNGANLARGDV